MHENQSSPLQGDCNSYHISLFALLERNEGEEMKCLIINCHICNKKNVYAPIELIGHFYILFFCPGCKTKGKVDKDEFLKYIVETD